MGSGLIQLVGAVFAERLRRVAHRAALLSTMVGIALTFIAVLNLRAFTQPIVGLIVFAVVAMLVYFDRVRFKGELPVGLTVVFFGAVLAWATGLGPQGTQTPESLNRLYLPKPLLGELWKALSGDWLVYLPVILSMGLFIVVDSIRNIESAEAAGDRFPTRPALTWGGIGILAAAAFGSCFPTTIGSGHPEWKAMGARAGYSVLNAAFLSVLCFSGALAWTAWLVPINAGIATLLWIGILIAVRASRPTPR